MSKYNRVMGFYRGGLWSLAMVRNAVGRWITAEEYKEITGQAY